MSKYEIVNNEGIYAIYSKEESAFFAGYDFMGSINWVKVPDVSCGMGLEEAQQIISDLEAQDDDGPILPIDPEEIDTRPLEEILPKQYILRAWIDGELNVSVVTAEELAHQYDMDQECGIYSKMEAWDAETMQQINYLDVVLPILDQERWIEEEYRNYCEENY